MQEVVERIIPTGLAMRVREAKGTCVRGNEKRQAKIDVSRASVIQCVGGHWLTSSGAKVSSMHRYHQGCCAFHVPNLSSGFRFKYAISQCQQRQKDPVNLPAIAEA